MATKKTGGTGAAGGTTGAGGTGEQELHCSFCGRAQHEVKKLVGGNAVFICDECITTCTDLMHETEVSDLAKAKESDELPTPQQI
ncbi:MAG: ClpX C4-type zinc finger protein, partial [Brachymonas sp.]